MKNKFWFCFFTAVVLIAVVFYVRQHTLTELREGNQTLRQRINAQSSAPATSRPQTTNVVAALRPDERTELMRLRGQILPLRDEFRDLSNRVVTLAKPAIQRASLQPNQSPPNEPSEMTAEMRAMVAFSRSESYMNARNFNLALRDYLKAHLGELPHDLAEVENSAGISLPKGVSERFELMQSGRIPEEALAYTLIAREKVPEQLADGKWRRIYLQANGVPTTSTLGSASPSDWEAFEHRIETNLKKQAQPK